MERAITLLMGEVAELPEGVASKVTVKLAVWLGKAVFCHVVPEVRHCVAMGFTTSVTIAVCVRLPLVPVMVTVELPAGVVLLVATVNVEVPAPLTDPGVKVAVAPAGKPLALSITAPLKPLMALTVAV